MTARLLDGKTAAAQIKADLKQRVAVLKNQGITPGLGTVLVGDDPGSTIYVAGKHRDSLEIGIESLRIDLPSDASQTDVMTGIGQLNANPNCTGYIVQLPLPSQIDASQVIEAIDPAKDADGLHPANLGALVANLDGPLNTPLPCTPRGIIDLIERNGISLAGAHVVVL
ncbi:MAG: bifunctional methylenetetrahydrofolate dehydrogenase/methenyltetrahydrofolate cyclohydrolase, partial [Micrococcales bacterium]|nr:bifunctional methylenetetrahydrofolate dehydrogenase/methenyltetrahydrofolate cyclohydrolase [Micrococcales bacterium]